MERSVMQDLKTDSQIALSKIGLACPATRPACPATRPGRRRPSRTQLKLILATWNSYQAGPRRSFDVQPLRRNYNWLSGGLLGFILFIELLTRNLLFGHAGKLKDEIDDLVFIDRCAKLGQGVGIVAVEVPDFLLAAR